MRFVITRRAALDLPDGINIFIFSLAQELLRRGHNVHVVGTSGADRGRIESLYEMRAYPHLVALTRAQSPHGYFRTGLAWLRFGKGVVAGLEPDFTLINGALPFKVASMSCTIAHDVERRITDRARIRTLYKTFSYRRSRYLVATSPEIRDVLVSELRFGVNEIHVIPTCVDLEQYESRPLSEREPIILHVGTADYKNPAATLRAYEHLRRPEWSLVITGRPTAELRSAVSALPSQLRKQVDLVGYLSAKDLRRLLATARIVAVPSTYAVPVASPTVIEAFASGTPVAASTSITTALLENGVNGYASQADDPRTLADGIARLMEDDELWSHLAAQALARAQEFGAERVADAYLALANPTATGFAS